MISISDMSYGANAKRGRLFYFIELLGIKKEATKRQVLKLFYRRAGKGIDGTIRAVLYHATIRENTVDGGDLRSAYNAAHNFNQIASSVVYDFGQAEGLFAGVFGHFNFMPLLDCLIEIDGPRSVEITDGTITRPSYFSRIISGFVEGYR